jgi:anaerobic ribonucleoside-triphosphate reductase activating protein
MKLNIAFATIAKNVLGPGRRRILWVQGCPRRCPGCITPQMQSFEDREWVEVEALAERFGTDDVEGLTFVGGEPFSQAVGLASLVEVLQRRHPWSVMTYTGHNYADLQKGSAEWSELLKRTDILVDGEYMQERACDLLWRGSDNQTMYFLTDRYRHLEPLCSHRGRYLEFTLDATGAMVMIGIPPPGFDHNLAAAALRLGVCVR